MKREKSNYRVIAHIDMDAFYASVEVLDNPDLKGKPVIVGGSSRRGVVSAASYEARRFGVHSAMPIFQAKRLCPGGVFLPVRMRRYVELSRVVMKCLHEFSPLVEQVSVDEAYIDLTGTEHIFGDPWKVAPSIKNRIRDETLLTCSIGISTSRLLAKIASDMNKPDGITVIPPGKVPEFLAALPIGKVPGVGKKSEEGLIRIGIKRIGDLRGFSPAYIREKFGKFGDYLLRIADGPESTPIVPYSQPKSISNEQTLEEDTDNQEILKKYMMRHSENVGRRLRKQGLKGRTVVLKIKLSTFKQVTRNAALIRPTQSGRIIYNEAVKLLEACTLRSKVRLVGVGITGLEPVDEKGQLDLFVDEGSAEERWSRAEKAMDEIVKRFGDGAVRPGTSLD